MRYYKLVITDTQGNQQAYYTSQTSSGAYNPNALNIEFDIPVYPLATPAGSNYIRVWGISLQDLFQSSNYNGSTLELYAGMTAGLPLNNPTQQGLILYGTINQAFGNWQDINQTIDFITYPNSGSPSAPANIVFDWKVGQSMSDAISQTMTKAFPTYTTTININSKLVATSPDRGVFQTLTQFAQYIINKSKSVIPDSTYLGVNATIKQSSVLFYDTPTSTTPKEISFFDLIGQPTWIGYQEINLKTVLRADLNVGDYITIVTPVSKVVAQSYTQYKNQTQFTNTYQIRNLRHVGNFRSPQGDAWITNIEAVQLQT